MSTFPYTMKKSDLRARDKLGRAPEATELTGGESYRELDKIKKIYNLVFTKIKIEMLNKYLSDDSVIDKVQDHINNKIKVSSDGSLYLNVFDKIKFEPDTDKGDTFNTWVKNKKNFKDLQSLIRQELWARADDKWEEKAKTLLLDVPEDPPEIVNEPKWSRIKNTQIKAQFLRPIADCKKLISQKELVKLCYTLECDDVIFNEDYLTLIYDKNISWYVKYNLDILNLVETNIFEDSVEYLCYIYDSAMEFPKSKILTNARELKLWNRIIIGFNFKEKYTTEFHKYLTDNYGQEILNHVRFKPDFFANYLDTFDAKKFKCKYADNEGFQYGNYYLIGKEFISQMPNANVEFSKATLLINDSEIKDLELMFLNQYYMENNIYHVSSFL